MFIDALWSPAGKGLTSWPSFVISNCEECHFPIGILDQVWCLIVSVPDLYPLSYVHLKSVINISASDCNETGHWKLASVKTELYNCI